MKRRYRVRENKRFQEIRRAGRSYANELLVLCALPNSLPYSRYGFSVSSRIGNAVTRNRIKRRLREAVRLRMDQIAPGWDIVFIARHPIRSADYHAMDVACARLLRRAQLFTDTDTGASRRSPNPAPAQTRDLSNVMVESKAESNQSTALEGREPSARDVADKNIEAREIGVGKEYSCAS